MGDPGRCRVERRDRLVEPCTGRAVRRGRRHRDPSPSTRAVHRSSSCGAISVGHEPTHDLRRGDEGVVGAVRHRAVAGGAGDPEPQPREPLLGDADGDAAPAVVADLRPAAGLGEHVVGADRVPVVIDHVLGAPLPAGLLVGDAEVDQRPSRPEALVGESPERHRHRRRDVEHVDRAPTPDLVDARPRCGTSSPPNGSRDQPAGFTGTTSVWPIRHSDGAVGIGALDAGDDRRPARAGLEALRRRARRPRGRSVRRSALRTSLPLSGEPSLTHSLRMSDCSSSAVAPVNSSVPEKRERPSHRPKA